MSMLVRNKINLLVCDMAGTIVNEKGIIYNAIGNTLNSMGFETTKVDIRGWHGKDKNEVLYKEISKAHNSTGGHRISHIVKEAEEKLLNELEIKYFKEENMELIDDELLVFFDKLRLNGIKVALNTGYPEEFQNKIVDYFNLENRVDAYISSEVVRFGRPAPYMIYRLMEQCDINNIKNVAKIGDTVNDMLEGRNAGCGLTIGVLSGASKKEDLLKYADVVLNKITDLNVDDAFPAFLL